MSLTSLKIDTAPNGVIYLTLNRPEKKNAMNADMLGELRGFAQAIPETARAVVLKGAGDVFCAGGDLDWMRRQIEASRATRMAEARKLADALHALNEMPVPLIGQIHGCAFGGGVGLACICDSVIASDDTMFGLTETKLGLIPATIGPYVVARLGEGAARRIFMSSHRFGAEQALNLGIIANSVPAAKLDAAVMDEIKPYLSTAPGAVGRAKALVRSLGPVIDDAVIEDSIKRLADAWESDEAKAGLDAFLAKRPPPWA